MTDPKTQETAAMGTFPAATCCARWADSMLTLIESRANAAQTYAEAQSEIESYRISAMANAHKQIAEWNARTAHNSR